MAKNLDGLPGMGDWKSKTANAIGRKEGRKEGQCGWRRLRWLLARCVVVIRVHVGYEGDWKSGGRVDGH